MIYTLRPSIYFCTFALLTLLTACGDGGDGNLDQGHIVDLQGAHLLQEQHLAGNPGLRVRPHHTVALNLESDTSHEGDSGGVGYDIVPYEILSAGWFSFCVGDDDGEDHYTVLRNEAGLQIATWRASDATCEPVRLEAGSYDLEVHHGGKGQPDDKPDMLFIAPQAVRYAELSSGIVARASAPPQLGGMYEVTVPRAATVLDLLSDQPDEGWVLNKVADASASGTPDSDSILEVLDGDTVRFSSLSTGSFDREKSLLYPRIPGTDNTVARFTIGTPDPASTGGWLSTGNHRYPVRRYEAYGASVRKMTGGGHWVTDYYGHALGAGDTPVDFKLNLNATQGNAFRLSQSGNSYSWIYDGDEYLWLFSDQYGLPSKALAKHEVYPSHRIGVTQGQELPKLFPEEVALFDKCYDPSTGFPEGTRYMTTASRENLGAIWTGLFPDQPGVHTIVSPAESRAFLYSNPSFQGDFLSVTSPYSGQDVLATCSNSTILSEGTAQSIDVQSNENNISHQEYEHQILVQSNVCVGCDLKGFDGSGNDLSGSDFNHADLSGAKFAGADLSDAVLSYANLDQADLSDTNLEGAEITGALLTSTDLTTTRSLLATQVQVDSTTNLPVRRPSLASSAVAGSLSSRQSQWTVFHLEGTTMNDWVLSDVELPDFSWSGVIAKGARFTNVTMTEGDLSDADLSGALFDNVSFTGVDFSRSNLQSAAMDDSIFNQSSFYKVDLTGVSAKSAQFRSTRMQYANLSDADFSDAIFSIETSGDQLTQLDFAYLNGTNLTGADLSGVHASSLQCYKATLTDVNFSYANLSNANLAGITLAGNSASASQAVLDSAVLTNSILDGVDLTGASLVSSHLEGASFTGATLYGAKLTNAALSSDSGTYAITLLDYVNEAGTDKTLAYGMTTLPSSATDGNTACPSGEPGPCEGNKMIPLAPPPKPKPVDNDHW